MSSVKLNFGGCSLGNLGQLGNGGMITDNHGTLVEGLKHSLKMLE